MKTLSELRELFVSARQIAKEASPERTGEAADKLEGISEHCKELYETETSYLERARCRNLYESIDNVITILRNFGFCNETVAAFFGFLDSTNRASFGDISSGRAAIRKADIPGKPTASATGAESKSGAATPGAKASVIGELGGDTGSAKPAAKAGMKPLPAAASASKPTAPAASSDTSTDPVAVSADPADASAPVAQRSATLDPESLDGFIGQEFIVKRIKEEINAAKKQGRSYIDHILLFGNRGLGKSTLMKLIAKELGVKFERMDATSFMNDVKSHRLFNETFVRLANEGEPVVIGIDEIHALPVRLQTGLLTLLQDRVYSYVTPSGTKNVPMPEFTFIGATTDYNAVLSTVKDRCSNLTFILEDYKRSDLEKIFNNKFAAMGLSVEEHTIIDQCINRCRSSIREVNAIISGLNTKAVNRNNGVITMDMVDEYFSNKGIDAIGLNKTEMRILEVINDEPSGNISEDTLASRLNIDAGLLTSEHEPYLIKLGFLSISSKGRSLTQRADDYLRYGYYVFDDGFVVGSKPAADGEIKLSNPGATSADPSDTSASSEAPAAEPSDASASTEAPAAEPSDASASTEAPAAEPSDASASTEAPTAEPSDASASTEAPAAEPSDASASSEAPAAEPSDTSASSDTPAGTSSSDGDGGEAALVVPSFSSEQSLPADGEGAEGK